MPVLDLTQLPAPLRARLVTAMGRKLSLSTTDTPPVPRDATPAEVRDDVYAYLRSIVHDQERIAAEAGRAKPAFDPT